MSSYSQALDPLQHPLSIAIISPDRARRTAAAEAFSLAGNVRTREFVDYPAGLADVPHLFDRGFDAILIDLDANPQFALELVEALCVSPSAIVMVFSAQSHPDLMLRSMHAGAREFFTMPFSRPAIAGALLWISSQRRPANAQNPHGRLLVFFGSKGGVGVTTVASNFAVALAQDSGKSTLLIDLNLHLGDAAMNLGLHPPYSTLDALENYSRLDHALLSTFLITHSSGLSVLAAPAELPAISADDAAIGAVLAVARQMFEYVVIDAGKKIDLKQMHLFEKPATAYLVTQVGIPELRNANRLIAQFSDDQSPSLEIVVNRHQSRFLGLTDEHLVKALTRPPHWKIPNDYAAVRAMQSAATPIVDRDSPMSAVIRRMALAISGSSATAGRQPVNPALHAFRLPAFHLPWKATAKPPSPNAGAARPDPIELRAVRTIHDPIPR